MSSRNVFALVLLLLRGCVVATVRPDRKKDRLVHEYPLGSVGFGPETGFRSAHCSLPPSENRAYCLLLAQQKITASRFIHIKNSK